MCTAGYARWLHRDSRRRWGSAKNHPWREQQKLLGSSPKLWPGPPRGISFGEKRLSFFSTAVRGWDGTKPAPSDCREQNVPAVGGVSPAVVPPRAQGRSQLSRSWANRWDPTHLLGAVWRVGRCLAAAGGALLPAETWFYPPANPNRKRGLLSRPCESIGWSGLVLYRSGTFRWNVESSQPQENTAHQNFIWPWDLGVL